MMWPVAAFVYGRVLFQSTSMSDRLFVQVGCGMSTADGWRNFDASPTLRYERIPLLGLLYRKNKTRFPKNAEYGDIVKGLPVRPKSADGIYCSHVLEHLALADVRTALSNSYSVLKDGGVFRMVLPDLEFYVKNYVNDDGADSAMDFMKGTLLGRANRSRRLGGFLRDWWGNSLHLWMWDYKALAKELGDVGFVEVRRAEFLDSGEEMFARVESENRWTNCLGIQCRR
jgi:predicted SAM-dependent methyltransferase